MNNNTNQPRNELKQYYHTESNPTGLVLHVTDVAKYKMDAYVRMVAVEVGWMGLIRQQTRHHEELGIDLPTLLILEDVFLYEQEVSGGSVDSGLEANIDISEILQKMIDQGMEDRIPDLRFFAHSHANMGVYHSGVDTDMIDTWAATGLDWFISHVQNKKGEVNVRFDMFLPFRLSVPVTEVPIMNHALNDEVESEIMENVRPKKWNHPNNTWQNRFQSQSNKHFDKNSKEGCVVSDEFKDQFDPKNTMSPQMGMITRPVVRYKTFDTNNGEREVRQEIVHGVIIHEAFKNSPAANQRTNMSVKDQEEYYANFMKKYPMLDPTEGRLEQSRSIQRSESKKTLSTTTEQKQLTAGEDTAQGSNDQIQTPNGVKSVSGREKSGEEDKKHTNSSKNGNEGNEQNGNVPKSEESKHVLTEEEQQESLIVIEDPSDSEKPLEDQVNAALEQMGYGI